MLTLRLAEEEYYDSEKQMFIYTKPLKVRMEHSLISVTKWEGIWEKPFLPVPNRTEGMSGREEELSYIRCMIIGEVDEHVPIVIRQNHSTTLSSYIEKKHSATTIYRRVQERRRPQVITAELVYYWMIKFRIPFECERWHFNRLLMLIDVCNIKESEGTKRGKMSPRQASNYMQNLNRERMGQ